MGTDDHDVDLEVGENVIRVQVTAEDGATMRTYQVTVTRRVSMLVGCEAGAVWCTTMTVGAFQSTDRTGYGYCTHSTASSLPCDSGSLDDDGFTLGSTGYTVEGVLLERFQFHGFAPFVTLDMDEYFPVSDLPSLTFRVGAYSLALADALEAVPELNSLVGGYVWPAPAGFPELVVGDLVTVQLSALPSTDATLSGLALSGNGAAVALDEPFDPDDTMYTASVANPGPGRVTVRPATSHAYATVKYFDGDGNVLDDADMGTDDHDVDLEVGENVIRVQVTAQDGDTMRTYQVTVTRAAYACTAPDLAGRTGVWSGTLTVGEALSGVHGYLTAGAVGGLSDTTFDVGSNSYAIDGVVFSAQDGRLFFSLTGELASADSEGLRLHVCDAHFALGDASYSGDVHHDYVCPTAASAGPPPPRSSWRCRPPPPTRR